MGLFSRQSFKASSFKLDNSNIFCSRPGLGLIQRHAEGKSNLKSGKNENIIDEDDDSPTGESDWSENDSADEEKETRYDDAKGNDERTEVGKIKETSVIRKLGNKPPNVIKINR